MVQRFINSLIVFFLLTSVAFATQGIPVSTHWIPAGWGGGGNFNNVIYDKTIPNRVYSMTDVGGGWVSTDDGEHWVSFNGGQNQPNHLINNMVTALAQSDANPNMLVINSNTGVSESLDRGVTWTSINSTIVSTRNANHLAITLDHTNTNIIYDGDDNGNVWVTNDNGVTWNILTRAGKATTTNVGSSGQATLAATLTHPVNKSTVSITDTTEIWTDDGAGHLTSNLPGYVAGTINYTTGVVALTWTGHTSTAQPVANYQVDSTVLTLALSADNTTLFIGTSSRLRVYNVNTNTFVDQTFSGNSSTSINRINEIRTYHLAPYDYVIVSAGLALAYTINDGASWTYSTTINDSLGTLGDIYKFDAVPYNGSVRIFVSVVNPADLGHNIHFYLSDDMGVTWGPNVGCVPSGCNAVPTVYTDLIGDPTRVWAGQWQPYDNYLTLNPFNPQEIMSGDGWGIFKSTDSAGSWYEKILGAQNQVLNDTKIDPEGRVWASGMDIGSLSTASNGVNWTSMSPNGSNTNNNRAYGYFQGEHWKLGFFGTAAQWLSGLGTVIEEINPWFDAATNQGFDTFMGRSTHSAQPGTYLMVRSPFPQVQTGGGMWGIGYMRSLGWSPLVAKAWAGWDGYNAGHNVAVSSDQGATWQYPAFQPGGIITFYNALGVDPTDPTGCTVAFASFAGGNGGSSPYITKNCGTTAWSFLNNTAYGQFTIPASTVSQGAVYTTNGTNNFTVTAGITNGTQLGVTITATPASSGTLTLVSGTGPSTIPYTFYASAYELSQVTQIKFGDDGKLYAGTYNGDLWFTTTPTIFGSFQMLHHFPSTMISPNIDGLTFDPQSNNRMTISVAYPDTDAHIWMTADLQDGQNSQWYDISGDLPCREGSNEMAYNYAEGAKGYLYVVTYGCGVFKLDLNDVPAGTHFIKLGGN